MRLVASLEAGGLMVGCEGDCVSTSYLASGVLGVGVSIPARLGAFDTRLRIDALGGVATDFADTAPMFGGRLGLDLAKLGDAATLGLDVGVVRTGTGRDAWLLVRPRLTLAIALTGAVDLFVAGGAVLAAEIADGEEKTKPGAPGASLDVGVRVAL